MRRSQRPRLRRPGLAAGGIVVVAGLAVTASSVPTAVRAPAYRMRSDARPPTVRMVAGVPHVTNNDGSAVLVPDIVPPSHRDPPARLLFFEGRSTQPDGAGSIVVDGTGAILEVNDRLRPTFLAAEIGTRRLESAVRTPGGALWLADADGDVLVRDHQGDAFRSVESPFAYPTLVLDPKDGAVWAVRSSRRFDFPLGTDPAPLAVRLAPAGTVAAVGEAILPGHILLRTLANAGHLAVSGDTTYFAPFIRDQLIAYGPDGDTLWIATRGLPQSTPDPRFEIDNGRPVIDYHPVNLGLAQGPDGRLYLLSTPGFTTMRARLDVFDPSSGILLRSAALPTPLPTLAADASGRVYALDSNRLLGGVPPAARPAGPALELPRLGGGTASLADFHGHVVLINVWASWCGPCRREMPALDRLRRRLADSAFTFLAVNEDHDVGKAQAFVREFGFTFPVLLGEGTAEAVFHYPGLPYTVLLDREGRVVRRWIGQLNEGDVRTLEGMIRRELAEDGGPAAGMGHRAE